MDDAEEKFGPCPIAYGLDLIGDRWSMLVLRDVTVREPGKIRRAGAETRLDGRRLDTSDIPLSDDGARHTIEIRPRE